ncbi:hypothetical protein TW95_gp0906 [Pandoravirus inopinatum]|uniref:Uncharacterized protein n=1 Tax=Pandoravirus inopinatum TaxID=1605721 RepID=A0A0B5J740_9VIRU|nr:hypothetical protein TW95_gp0906 [Pandoravirus inopinatum]AJF97640.1 hypothetical protein [Pandoravirus inopinatum]
MAPLGWATLPFLCIALADVDTADRQRRGRRQVFFEENNKPNEKNVFLLQEKKKGCHVGHGSLHCRRPCPQKKEPGIFDHSPPLLSCRVPSSFLAIFCRGGRLASPCGPARQGGPAMLIFFEEKKVDDHPCHFGPVRGRDSPTPFHQEKKKGAPKNGRRPAASAATARLPLVFFLAGRTCSGDNFFIGRAGECD